MSGFLVCHEVDEGEFFGVDGEFGGGEAREAVMKEVQLDPFLVKAEGDGFESKPDSTI